MFSIENFRKSLKNLLWISFGGSISVSYTHLDVYKRQVLGTKNIYGYNFSSDGNRSTAIKPPTDTFIFVGWFISFGIDKTQEAINGNL